MRWLPTHACACHVYRPIGQAPPDTRGCPFAFPFTARHTVPSPFPPLHHLELNLTPKTQHRLALARLLLAVADKDRARIVKCYTDMGGWVGWHI